METGKLPFGQSADGEEVSKTKSRPSFLYFYCQFRSVAAQLTFPLLLALSHFTHNIIVLINTGNGDGEPTIWTVSQWGGGK